MSSMVGFGSGIESTRAHSQNRGSLAFACVVALVALSGCEGDAARRTLRDSGAACVNGPAMSFGECSVRTIAPSVPLQIDVDFATCTSSSCDKVLNAACRASRSGSVITIEAEAVIESQGDECTDDCGSVTASCALEALPEGTYELRYGDDTATLTVPSTTAAACAGTGQAGRCCDTNADCGGATCQNRRCL